MSDPNKSFLLVCRDAAKECPDVTIRKLLRDAADDLAAALVHVANEQSIVAMQHANACWANAHRILLAAFPTPAPIPPKSDSAREAIAA